MKLRIRHETAHDYAAPSASTVQLIRLTPRSHGGQRVRFWRIGDGTWPSFEDGFGNWTQFRAVQRPHGRVRVVAEGEVETTDTQGVLRDARETLPARAYLRGTERTEPDESIRALADEIASHSAIELDRLHALMQAVRDRVDWVAGATESTTTAAQALADGRGVCQDHAQLFCSTARLLGIPARYVSGYFWPGEDGRDEPASHAWAEAFVPALGWVGFDPANRQCPTDRYVRVAIGLDSFSAAPVHGIRLGVGSDSLVVTVRVDAEQ
jgi:transglutaminase-like putative cysteine protease